HIVQQRALPPAAKCLICHHPPLYYLLGAGVYAFFEATRAAPPILGLQLFSLLITLGFVVYGVLLARRFFEDPRYIRLTAAFLLFWPYSIHNSVRVHNDTLLGALLVAALYYAVAWYQDGRPRDLYLAAAMSALGVLTKSSAYPLIALLFALIALRLLRPGGRLLLLRRAAVVAAVLAAALTLNTFRKGEGPKGAPADLCHRVLGSACDVHPSSLMENRPYNYIYLDIQGFLREPYVLTDKDETGRQLFWNHLLKSSLFGSHNKTPDRETAYELNRHVAAVMSALLLAMVAYLLVGAASASREGLRKYTAPLLALASMVAFLAAFRALLPAPHHTDFRHVFPALAPAALLYAAAVAHFDRKERALGPVGWAMASLFLALSVFYFTPKYGLVLRFTRRMVPQELAPLDRVVAEGTPWDRDGNLLFEGNHILQFRVPRKNVQEIDVTLDSNDVYQITLETADGPRVVRVGPGRGPGLARYIETLDPPARAVRELRLEALRGDRAYSVGHLVLR
ncbi:MAG TPA: glycosyltransferase family 39 protein, partial [Candidatus Nanopelagicales bacterium]|nr:glycosyltransferase family 39 protein [Candidatus Nanopelagicales bacterium]